MTIIRFAGLKLLFLQDKHGTNGGIDLFTTTVQPRAGMPIPHYHESWDETVYGLTGTTTWTIDGKEVAVEPGSSAFIPRGIVHGFANRSDAPATFLSALTPGVLGPEYFQETADLVNSGKADPNAMKALMLRYGLVPVSQRASRSLCRIASDTHPEGAGFDRCRRLSTSAADQLPAR